ncbi:hypothetical protein G3O06_02085 [Burkholderia sp. Ac-20345]|uniref:hypothetical protein n=1 Tax=Burkholderia sp. Ac-20345 TaxID=2703891 RepID=UPI00197C9C97|nr:hypothetical protein [Burkholderia sp. Ac-20345]MBN3776352.1 hypothetical protein [Burkholderia sp. Ac-20345]
MDMSLLHYSRMDMSVEIIAGLVLVASYFLYRQQYRLVWLAVFLAMSAYYTYVSNVPMRAILTGIFALYQGIRIGRSELKAKKMNGGPRTWPR